MFMNSPTCSLSLKTYSLQPKTGFLASGGSLYLSTVFVPSAALTVFVAAAKSPEGAKLGLALSMAEGDLEPECDREGGLVEWGRERREGDAERRDGPVRSLSLALSRYRSLSLSLSRVLSRSSYPYSGRLIPRVPCSPPLLSCLSLFLSPQPLSTFLRCLCLSSRELFPEPGRE